jgi:hypothetical protein
MVGREEGREGVSCEVLWNWRQVDMDDEPHKI